MYSGKFIVEAIYLRKVEIDGRIYSAAPTHVSTVGTSPAPAAKSLGVGLRLIFTAVSALWQVSPRSDGADLPALAA
jgi:hypothetical protein